MINLFLAQATTLPYVTVTHVLTLIRTDENLIMPVQVGTLSAPETSAKGFRFQVSYCPLDLCRVSFKSKYNKQ